MSKSLAAHNATCNGIYLKFQECQKEHPYRKFIGACDPLYKELNKCIAEQRVISRERNKILQKEKRERTAQQEQNK